MLQDPAGINFQLQGLFPRPRGAVRHLEVSPLSWGLGETRGQLFIGASKGEKLVSEGIRSSYCVLLPLCVASLAGWFALRFCQFEEGLKRSQIPELPLGCLSIWCSSCRCSQSPGANCRTPQCTPSPGWGEGMETVIKLHGHCWD